MSEGNIGPPPARAFWDRVEAARRNAGWTKLQLAERSGVARATIDRLRNGRRPPLPATVNALAEALEIDREEAHRLAGLTAERTVTDDRSELEQHLETLLSRVPAHRREVLARMREEERERQQRLHRQAREEYLRAIDRIAQIARLEAAEGNNAT